MIQVPRLFAEKIIKLKGSRQVCSGLMPADHGVIAFLNCKPCFLQPAIRMDYSIFISTHVVFCPYVATD